MRFRQCYGSWAERKANCPVCDEDPLNQLTEGLPYARRSQSRLICRLSGLPMDDDNPPMMLPNGYVYGQQVTLFMTAFLRRFAFRYYDKIFVIHRLKGTEEYGEWKRWMGNLPAN